MSREKIIYRLALLVCILGIVSSTNTFSVLQCRYTKCFDEFYSCQSEKVCLDEYNYLNKCMQNGCLSSNSQSIDCYHNCKTNHISNPHLSSYIACVDRQCYNEQFFQSCGDAYQNLLREQNRNSPSWKTFSTEVNKCVQKTCSSSKSNKRDLLHCQLKQTVECSKQSLNSYRHISFLNNFYECISDSNSSTFHGSEGQDQNLINKVLGMFGISF